MAAMEPAENELWMRYRNDNDPEARDRLFTRYVPWAAAIARSVHLRVRAYHVDRDDFVQNANIGLLDAMSRYDPERGVAFQLYAKPRVRGAVFNGLKAILGDRPPAADNLRFAERLESLRSEDDGSAMDDVVNSIVGLGLGYLLDEAARALEQQAPVDALTHAQAVETEQRVLQAVEKLPDRMQHIVLSHYFNYVPFQAIAEELDVTKGRVSQLHHAALAKLRALLRESV